MLPALPFANDTAVTAWMVVFLGSLRHVTFRLIAIVSLSCGLVCVCRCRMLGPGFHAGSICSSRIVPFISMLQFGAFQLRTAGQIKKQHQKLRLVARLWRGWAMCSRPMQATVFVQLQCKPKSAEGRWLTGFCNMLRSSLDLLCVVSYAILDLGGLYQVFRDITEEGNVWDQETF